jgi:glycine hydroxymethyltransferase
MGENEMERIADWIDEAVNAARDQDEAAITRIGDQVRELAVAFPIPGAAV